MPTEIAVVELLDEFSFEQTYHDIPATLAALRAREAVVLVQDDSCEYVVTLERGRALKLWNPEVHWADHPTVAVQGTLAEAVARARAWLRRYLDAEPDAIEVVIDVDAFPAGPLAPVPRKKPMEKPR